jgi:LysM repeat protein
MIAPEGTTMRAISQQYAIPIQKLYRYNNFKIGQQPQKGEEIRLKPKSITERLNRE